MKTSGNSNAPEFNRKDSVGLGIISGGLTCIINQNSQYLGHQIKILFPNSPIELIQKKDALAVFLMASLPVIIFDRVHNYCMTYFAARSPEGKVSSPKSFFSKVLTIGMAGGASVGLGYVYQESYKASLSISITGFLIYYAIKSIILLRTTAANTEQPESPPVQEVPKTKSKKSTPFHSDETTNSTTPKRITKQDAEDPEKDSSQNDKKKHLRLDTSDRTTPINSPKNEPTTHSPGSNPTTPKAHTKGQLRHPPKINTHGLQHTDSKGSSLEDLAPPGRTPKSSSSKQRPNLFPTVVLSPNTKGLSQTTTIIPTADGSSSTRVQGIRESGLNGTSSGSPLIKPINPSSNTAPPQAFAVPSPFRAPAPLSLGGGSPAKLPPRPPSASLRQHNRKPSNSTTPPQTPQSAPLMRMPSHGRLSPSLLASNGNATNLTANPTGKISPPSASSEPILQPVTLSPAAAEPVKHGVLTTPNTTPVAASQPLDVFLPLDITQVNLASLTPTPRTDSQAPSMDNPFNKSIAGDKTPLYTSPSKPVSPSKQQPPTPTPSTPSSSDELEMHNIKESTINSVLTSQPIPGLPTIQESPDSRNSASNIAAAAPPPLSPIKSPNEEQTAKTENSSSSATSAAIASSTISAVATPVILPSSSSVNTPSPLVASPESKENVVASPTEKKKKKKKDKKGKKDTTSYADSPSSTNAPAAKKEPGKIRKALGALANRVRNSKKKNKANGSDSE